MTAPASLAAEHQDRSRAVARSAAAVAAAAWGEVDPGRVSATWTEQLPAVLATLIAGQAAAARLAQPYTDQIAGRPAAAVLDPAAFAGVASDGRFLAALLFQPALTALRWLTHGSTPAQGLASGLAALDMIVRTQVADAGRVATGVATTAHPDLAGHERVVHLPSCGRCIVLAGRLYRWSDGFQRHPRCDCTMLPVTSEQWRTTNLDNHPKALFERMSTTEQERRFGPAGAAAIRDGADIAQVVNARSGMSTASVGGRQVATTTTGTTRRGLAGARLGARFGTGQVVSEFNRISQLGTRQRVRLRGAAAPRLMPEEIYRVAADRDHALQLLRLHGYLL